MLEMAARVLSKFMGADYSRACLHKQLKYGNNYKHLHGESGAWRGFDRAAGVDTVFFELPSFENIVIIEGCTEFCYADTNV